MVTRWNFNGMRTEDDGLWVRHEDYLSLQAALREALNTWEAQISGSYEWMPHEDKIARIAELRKQFLDI